MQHRPDMSKSDRMRLCCPAELRYHWTAQTWKVAAVRSGLDASHLDPDRVYPGSRNGIHRYSLFHPQPKIENINILSGATK